MTILLHQGQYYDFQRVKILKKTTETASTFSRNISEAV